MEPRFQLNFTNIIFGGQALTDQILVDLGISLTCLLCGNYHHLINEVTFKNYLFAFECMLLYVARSKTNILVCQLKNTCNEGYKSFGFGMSQPPPTVQYLSQSNQMMYDILLQSEQKEYGFSSSGMAEPL
jgi:hypothetical protein